MLGDSININNFNWKLIVLKKIPKYLKITVFWPNLCKNEIPMGHAQTKKRFLLEITKTDHKLSKTFCFIKISYVIKISNEILTGHAQNKKQFLSRNNKNRS